MQIKKFVNKLSIFDIIPVILGLGLVVYLFLSFLGQKSWIEVEMRVMPEKYWWSFNYPPAWLSEDLQVGDKSYNFKGKKIAEVTDLTTYKTRGEGQNTYLRVKILVSKDRVSKKLRYGSDIVEVGGPLSLHLDDTLVPGIITAIGSKWESAEKTIQVKGTGKSVDVVNGVKVGDIIRDGQDNLILEVLEKNVSPTKVIYMWERSSLIFNVRPTYDFFDVKLTLKIEVEKIDGDWYYQRANKILVGNEIDLVFPHVALGGLEITEVE